MLEPGALIHDRYRIIGLVGQGAMGAVYEALDQRIGQPVALKQTLTLDSAAMDALEREALILAGLRHPALPIVSDTFSDPLGQFLAMTFVPGPNLADLLEQRGRAFGPGEVLAWADQLLDALAYLHGQQPPVLHRDIKPQNLKLTPEGAIVLLDFGLARGAVFQTRLAGQRSMVGYTLPYAPIEQVRGQDTDPRSDLFALAGTLYHLLSGAPPPDALERAAAHIAGQPDPLRPLRERYPELPAPAADALDRCLRLDPAERIGSATELRRQLTLTAPERIVSRPVQPPARVSPRPAPPPERPSVGARLAILTLLTLGLVIAGFALSGGLAMFSASIGPTALPTEAAFPTPTVAMPTQSELLSAYPYPTPFLYGGITPTTLPVTPTPTAIPPFATATYPQAGIPGPYPPPLTPIVIAATAVVGSPRLQVECSHYMGGQGDLALSPDGQFVALNCATGLQVFSPFDGQTLLNFTYSARAFAFSPNATTLATASHGNEVVLWRLGDAQMEQLYRFEPDVFITKLAYSPDGSLLAALYSNGRGNILDTATGVIYVNPLGTTEVSDLTAVAFSPTSRYVAAGSTTGAISIWKHVGTDFQLIAHYEADPALNASVLHLAFSNDEQSLIAGLGEGGIWRYSLRADESPVELFDSTWSGAIVAASPADTTLAVGDASGRLAIYHEGLSPPLNILLQSGPVVQGMAFMPDGQALVVRSGKGFQVWSLPDQSLR